MRSRMIAVCALLLALDTIAWAESALWASPVHIGLLVGGSQRLQVLDREGHAYNHIEWVADQPELVRFSSEEGFSVVHALKPGRVALRGVVNGQPVSTDVTVYPGEQLPRHATTWELPPVRSGAKVVNQLQALSVSANTPALYIQESVGQSSYLRAVDADGIQQWVWFGAPKQQMHLICGDNFGGAVLHTVEDEQHRLVVLKQDGMERWRAETADWWAYTYTHGNIFYIVEDHADAAIVSAFDGDRGTRKLQVPLPTNLTTHIGYDYRPAGGRCQPGEQFSKSSRGSHGSMVSDSDGVAYVAASALIFTFDATGCTLGRPIDAGNATQRSETRLQLLTITPDGDSRWQPVRTLTQTVRGWDKPTEWLYAWGSTITDEGAVLIPAMGEIGNLRTRKSELVRTSIFRVTPSGVKEYDMPIRPIRNPRDWNMLLGENGVGFFGGDKEIAAYRVSDGHVLWTWSSSEPVSLYAALADGGVALHMGADRRKVIRLDKNGKFAEVVLDPDKAAVPAASVDD